MSFLRFCRVSLLALLSLNTVALVAQSADTSGLEVYVHDPSGALVPGAQLVLEQVDTHVQRKANADAAGHFRFAEIPVGNYQLSIAKEGFKPFMQTGLHLEVSQTPTLQITMVVGDNSQQVQVTSDVPILDTDRTTIGQNISQVEIDNLPADGRNFLDFALTVPGVTAQATGGQGSGLSFNGQRGRSNSILIDGVENNGQLNGTVRQALSIDAIAQYQVMVNQFQPEYGNTGGGLINIITKSGTNDFHGDAYYFARNQALNAYPIILNGIPFKPEYVQNDIGAVLGGPIWKDRTFFFASAEYLGLNSNLQTNIAPTTATLINNTLNAFPLAGSNVRVSSNPVEESNATTTASFRVDHRLGPNDNLTFRFLFGQYVRSNPTLDRDNGLNSDVSNYGFDTLKAFGFTGTETHTFTPTIINEGRLQYAPQYLTQHPNNFSPYIYISSFASFGQNNAFPTELDESHYEAYDAVTFSKKTHLYKAGVDAILIRAHTTYPIDYNGNFFFSGLTSAQSVYNFTSGANGPQPDEFTQTFGNPEIRLPDYLIAGFFQDSWKIKPRLELNYGIRYDVDLQPQGYNGDPTNPIQSVLPKGVPRDYNNFGPRVALAYSVDRNSHTVIRAGYGMFYDKIFLLVARNALLSQETLEIISPLSTSTTATLLRSLYSNGIYPNSAAYPTGPLIPAPSINSLPAHLPIPYAQQANLTVDQQLAKDWSAELTYVHVSGAKLLKAANTNLLAPTILTAANSAALTGSTTAPTYQTLLRPYYPTAKANPAFTDIEQVGSNGHSSYNAMTASIIHRTTESLTLRANYTWAKAMDDASDFTESEEPDNPLVPSAERALSTEDVRNTFVSSVVYNFPTVASNNSHSLKKMTLGDWVASSIAQVNSGSPWNATIGSDVNNDDNSDTDRPYVPGQQGVVMRRNSYRGHRQQNVSLRLQKKFYFRDTMRLQFSVEAFNLFNHTNYLSSGIYPYWGTAAAARQGETNALPGHANVTSLPLCAVNQSASTGTCTQYYYAFGAPQTAGPTRRLQLGVKYYF